MFTEADYDKLMDRMRLRVRPPLKPKPIAARAGGYPS
jgi:hypothetical protein